MDMNRIKRHIKRKLNIFSRRWVCFWKGIYFPKSLHAFGIDRFIKLENVMYGIADEIFVDEQCYLILVDSKNPFEIYVRQRIEDGDKHHIALVNVEDRDLVYKYIADSNRSVSEAMTRLLDYHKYGEVEVRSDISCARYITLSLLSYAAFIAGFLVGIKKPYNTLIESMSSLMWLTVSVYTAITIIVVLMNKRDRRYKIILSNAITALGLSTVLVLYEVIPYVVFTMPLILLTVFIIFSYRAFKETDECIESYMKFVTQRLYGVIYLTRSLITIYSFIFIVLFLYHHFIGIT